MSSHKTAFKIKSWVISKFTSSISIVAWIDESEKEKQP
jgi:hypothetical protein